MVSIHFTQKRPSTQCAASRSDRPASGRSIWGGDGDVPAWSLALWLRRAHQQSQWQHGKRLSQSIGGRLLFLAGAMVAIMELAAMVGFPGKALAQNIAPSYRLSVSPSTAFIQVKPGSTTTHSIYVRNPTDYQVQAAARVVDFTADGQTGLPQLSSDLTFPYLQNAPELAQPKIISPNGTLTLPVTISVPSDAFQQEYPLTILIQFTAGSEEDTTALNPILGSNLIVWISSETKPAPRFHVSSLQLPPIVDSFRPVLLKPLVQNLAPMSAVASGSATIKDWRGATVATMAIFPEVILGNSSREIQGAVPAETVLPTDPQAAFAPQLQAQPLLFTQPMWLGPYTVEFTFTSSSQAGAVSTTQVLHFFALPVSLLFIVIVVAAALIVGWWWQKRKSNTVADQPQTK